LEEKKAGGVRAKVRVRVGVTREHGPNSMRLKLGIKPL